MGILFVTSDYDNIEAPRPGGDVDSPVAMWILPGILSQVTLPIEGV
jgi:hypothetical protein